MKDIDLTVLFVDTIPARIYLALLKKHGYRPKKILFLDIEPASGKYQILRKFFGRSIATLALRISKDILHRVSHQIYRNNCLNTMG